MFRKGRMILFVSLFAALLGACSFESEYKRMLSRELESGVRNDSLFLGISFGMPRKDFYTHCWQLNKEGLIRQGPSNLSVEYQVALTDRAFMRFYPQFEENRISRMPMEFVYETFIPTDSATVSDALIVDVKALMEKWYGDGFLYLEDEEGSRALWIKVDGNRQIRIFKKDVSTVAVDITDMSIDTNKKDTKG